MGVLQVYCAAFLFLGSGCSVLPDEDSTNETRYIEFYDNEHNVTRVIDLEASPNYSVLQRSTPVSSSYYLLYTQNNPSTPQYLILNNANSVNASNYNASAQTVVVVHGWLGDQNSAINPTIRDAYLDVTDANIIVVDWSRVSSADYVTASVGAPGVGRALGRFLAFLANTTGASYSNMHLVGFSLGAHVVGNAGNYLNGQVARITGLDPAGPMWGPLNVNRLVAANAVYVEAIHTDSKLLGTNYRSGDVDFYPNGGNTQPGCAKANDACSHSRSWQLFAATVTYDHLVGRKCSTSTALTLNMCFGDYLSMGNGYLNKTENGQYLLKTKSNYPYAQIY